MVSSGWFSRCTKNVVTAWTHSISRLLHLHRSVHVSCTRLLVDMLEIYKNNPLALLKSKFKIASLKPWLEIMLLLLLLFIYLSRVEYLIIKNAPTQILDYGPWDCAFCIPLVLLPGGLIPMQHNFCVFLFFLNCIS